MGVGVGVGGGVVVGVCGGGYCSTIDRWFFGEKETVASVKPQRSRQQAQDSEHPHDFEKNGRGGSALPLLWRDKGPIGR